MNATLHPKLYQLANLGYTEIPLFGEGESYLLYLVLTLHYHTDSVNYQTTSTYLQQLYHKLARELQPPYPPKLQNRTLCYQVPTQTRPPLTDHSTITTHSMILINYIIAAIYFNQGEGSLIE